jgi:hypothetical protein
VSNRSIYDIREDEIELKGKAWDDEKIQTLAMRELYIVNKMLDWHKDLLARGEDLFGKYEGDILGADKRAYMEEVEDKIIIEPPIAKSPIRALLGEIIKARKSGSVAVEEGDIDNPVTDPDEIQTVNITLKDLELKTHEHEKFSEAIHDALISCYINVLLWHKRTQTGDNPLKFDLDHLPWNSCVFGPLNFRGPLVKAIRELAFFDWRSMADLIEDFPERESQIVAHWGTEKIDDKQISSIINWEADGETAGDISYLRGIINNARGNFKSAGGLIPIYQRLFPIKRKEEVWVKITDDEEGNDYEIIPENWSDSRKEKWIQENQSKYEGPIERPIITLWRTVFTSTGLVLSNEKHWYQEYGSLPATFIVPYMVNGKPTGPMVDMRPDVLRNCICQIEAMDDLRKGGGMTVFAKGGTFSHPENVASELNKSMGVVLLSDKFRGTAQEAINVHKREPSKAWREAGEFARSDMYENTRLNETMQGQPAPRQADIAKQTEIAQALAVNALYIDSFNHAFMDAQNMKLSMIPHIYDEDMVIVEGYDEVEKVTKSTMLNVPEYDESGAKKNIVNDITSRKYRWKPSPVDDSPTAKSRMMADALNIMNGAFGPLMQGDPSGLFLAKFLAATDNPVLNKMGRALEKDAGVRTQQQSELEKQKTL